MVDRRPQCRNNRMVIMKNRTLLMIPGPIEFEPAVLAALGAPTTGHVAPDFIEAFGQALERLREVFLSPDGQPFIAAAQTLRLSSQKYRCKCSRYSGGRRRLKRDARVLMKRGLS